MSDKELDALDRAIEVMENCQDFEAVQAITELRARVEKLQKELDAWEQAERLCNEISAACLIAGLRPYRAERPLRGEGRLNSTTPICRFLLDIGTRRG